MTAHPTTVTSLVMLWATHVLEWAGAITPRMPPVKGTSAGRRSVLELGESLVHQASGWEAISPLIFKVVGLTTGPSPEGLPHQ